MDVQATKNAIKQLGIDKGKLSRQIGDRKKAGEPFDDILEQIQSVSKELKRLESELKERSKTSGKITEPINQPLFPAHIAKTDPLNTSSSYEDIRLFSATSEFKDKWNDYVDQHPHSHQYQKYEFKPLIERSFGHVCNYYYALDSKNNIVGVLPTVETKSRLFGYYSTSIPFFNYGGPLADSSIVSEALIQHSAKIAEQNGSKHLEVRESHVRENYPTKTDKVSMFRSLPNNSEILWNDIGSKLRAQIKKGQQNHFQIQFGKLNLLDDFYHVFSTNMRDLGTPVYSKSFFENILKTDLRATVVVMYYKAKPVSCAFLLGYKDVLEIPWASTLKKANPLNANVVMYWHILEYACKQDYSFFDFGRSSKDANTYKFKKQWGAKPAPLYWHYWLNGGGELPQLNPNNPKYKLVISVWQRLPVWITTIIGPFLVKNLP